MTPHQQLERGLPCGGVLSIVVCKLCQGQVRRPVVLLIVDKEPKIRFEPLIGSFRLSIGPGVVSCGNILLDAEYAAQLLHELGCETGDPVANDFPG